MKSGTPVGEVVRQLEGASEPYLGGPGHLADAASPSRLETLARTNITDAYNQGRLSMAKDPDVVDLLAGMRYSTVLDDRTTEICQFLNDKVFEMDDPALEQLAPPNHFNCRSVLVPVTKGEAADANIDSGDFMTAGDVRQGLELRGSLAAAGPFRDYTGKAPRER